MRAIVPVLTSVVLALSTASASAQFEQNISVKLDIKRQILRDALNDWAQQTGCQLISPRSETVNQLMAPAIIGTMTPHAALKRILSGTSLTYQLLDDRTVLIVERPEPVNTTTWQSHQDGTVARRLAYEEGDMHSLRVAQTDAPKAQSSAADNGRSPSTSKNASENLIGEVIVSAQKREENLWEVPISISVLGGSDLDKSTVQGVTEVLNRVPGVATLVYAQGGGTNVAIRGVAAGSPVFVGSSPVSYYLDGIPFGFVKSAIGPDVNAYDLERVEVLRGPQGTLYGASALNGVVRVLTKDATLDHFELKARASVSTTEYASENYRGDMALNVPLIEGKLAARAVIGYQEMSGWINQPNEEDVNDLSVGTARFKLRVEPTERLSFDLAAWLSRTDFDGLSSGNESRLRNSFQAEPTAVDYDAYAVKIYYDAFRFSIASTTSYLDYQSLGSTDVSYSDHNFVTNFYSEVFSQEVVINSAESTPWQWSIGAMYRDAEDRLYQAITPFFEGDVGDGSESFAVFGDLKRGFANGKLAWTLGLRYFRDDVSARNNINRDLFVKDTFDATTPRAVLTWYPSDAVTVYGSYSEGFRSGGFQYQGFSPPDAPSVRPDTLRNYELGAKAALWDRRVNIDAAVYYIDWQDVQQSVTIPWPGTPDGVTMLLNGEAANGIGADFGIMAHATERLQLGASISWNDLTMDGEVRSFGEVLFSEGDRLNLSAEYTASASADYAFPIGKAGYTAEFSASVNYTSPQDRRTVPAAHANVFIAEGDAMTIGRASLSIQAPAQWVVTLFVDNISNEQDSPIRNPFAGGAPDPDNDARIRPRTIGAQFEYGF
jgi:iron complex outermembrane recepter protein